MTDALSLHGMRAGGKRAVAAALSAIERNADDPRTIALLDAAFAEAKGHVIGITGPPGVGKSSLIDALIRHWRQAGETVGVIAVDPSSRSSGGALLGDRTRMATDPSDQGVFVRSLASRGHLGGLAELAFASVVLLRALYDRVLVESVGVGQSEAEIVSVADTVVLCIQPGSGDSLQFMKAGIMEIPHLALVTKADFGAPARRALADLQAALSLAADGAPVQVLAASASSGEGMAALAAAIDGHWRSLANSGALMRQRSDQARSWIEGAIRAEAGRRGLVAARGALSESQRERPFASLDAVLRRLTVTFEA